MNPAEQSECEPLKGDQLERKLAHYSLMNQTFPPSVFANVLGIRQAATPNGETVLRIGLIAWINLLECHLRQNPNGCGGMQVVSTNWPPPACHGGCHIKEKSASRERDKGKASGCHRPGSTPETCTV